MHLLGCTPLHTGSPDCRLYSSAWLKISIRKSLCMYLINFNLFSYSFCVLIFFFVYPIIIINK